MSNHDRFPVFDLRFKRNPDVTIVIAVYNDPNNLANAVQSAVVQTHSNIEIIIVDDCSTDNSYERALELAATDGRIKVLRTPSNSGGVGGPRNAGRRAAQAKWLTFLDSDDELDTHACKNLLNAAIGSDVDLVAGKTKRYNVATNRWSGWHERLYPEGKVIEGIESCPELAIDTIAVGKLYSKEFLDKNSIFSPEDIHYEDLVFSAEIYKNAKKIVLIPNVIYVWKIYPVNERKSITNQRDSIRNLENRLEALARIDSLMADGSTPALADRLQLKILRHDARLYLNDIAKHEDELSAKILVLLRPRILAVSPSILELLDDQERILYLAALSGVPENVRWALRMLRGMVTAPTAIQPFSLWSDRNGLSRHMASTEQGIPSALLDINPKNYVEIPWFKFHFLHKVTSIKRVDRYRFIIHGETDDLFDHLLSLPDFSIDIEIFSRSGDGTRKLVRANVTDSSAGKVSWEASLTIPELLPHQGTLKLGLMVLVSRGALCTKDQLFVAAKIPSRKSLIVRAGVGARLSREAFFLYRTVDSTLGFKQRKISTKRIRLRACYQSASTAWTRTLGRLNEAQQVPPKLLAIVSKLFRLLPIRTGSVLFESHMGKSYSDSPKAISLALSEARPDLKQVWSFAQNSRQAHSCEHETVVRGSVGYLRALARAEYLVDNQSWPSYFGKRAGQTYLQTWHGVPLKLMGYDTPAMKSASSAKRAKFRRNTDSWDYLCNPSPFFEESFAKSFQYRGRLLPYGSPRNDELISPKISTEAIRAKLGIRTDRKIVLYAPTFRASNTGTRRVVNLNLDLEGWIDALGDSVQLLVRPHYLNRLSIPAKYASSIVDVSGVDNITDLYRIADLLVTDYSSVMFDFAVLNRPIVLFTYDLESYMNEERGTYFDITEFAPGVIVKTQDELHSAVTARLRRDLDLAERTAFFKRFMGAETGHASGDAISTIWGNK